MGNTGSSSGSEDEASLSADGLDESPKVVENQSGIVSAEQEIIKVYNSSRPYLEEIHGKHGCVRAQVSSFQAKLELTI